MKEGRVRGWLFEGRKKYLWRKKKEGEKEREGGSLGSLKRERNLHVRRAKECKERKKNERERERKKKKRETIWRENKKNEGKENEENGFGTAE